MRRRLGLMLATYECLRWKRRHVTKTLEFSLVSPLWKKARSIWNYIIMCRVVSIHALRMLTIVSNADRVSLETENQVSLGLLVVATAPRLRCAPRSLVWYGVYIMLIYRKFKNNTHNNAKLFYILQAVINSVTSNREAFAYSIQLLKCLIEVFEWTDSLILLLNVSVRDTY